MAEFLGPSIEEWAKKKGKNISWLTRATKAANGEAEPQSVIEEAPAIPEEQKRVIAETNDAPPIEPDEIPQPDIVPAKPEFGHTLNKDMMWQAIIGAAPALLGAAIGGPQGGAAGAQAGLDSLQNLRNQRLEIEKQQAAQDLKDQALEVNKAKVKVAAAAAGQKLKRQAEQDSFARERFAETKRHNAATEGISGDKFDVANAKDLQNSYMKDPIVVKANEALKSIKEAKGLIASGTKSDATKVQLKIAAIYNQGRPSDQDFKAVQGSQAYWDKIARWYKTGFGNQLTETDLKELNRTLSVMEQVNTKARSNARQQWINLGSRRLGVSPQQIMNILPESLESTYQSDEESAQEREDLLKEIQDLME